MFDTFDYEKLEAWESAIQLTKEIYAMTDSFPASEKCGLISQLQQAMIAVSTHLAGGSAQTDCSDKAYRKLMEASSQLSLAHELKYLSDEQFEQHRKSIEELAKKIRASQRIQTKAATTYPTEKGDPSGIFIHETAVIDDHCQIGAGTKIWHFSHLMSNSILGEDCNIGQNVVISPQVVLGNNVKVQNNVSIYTGVICEDDVFLGPSMVFTNVINPRSAINRRNEFKQTIVRKGATIGANATIICGNEIGTYAMVGAGAVVTRPVKAYALVVGNPARPMGWVSEYGHPLVFDEQQEAVCTESGQQYRLINDQVNKLL